MEIVTFPLGQMQANCYLFSTDEECLIIDPADEASFILEEIQRRHLKLIGMIATHGHFDHIMAAGEIQMTWKVPLFIDDHDRFLINRLEETAKHFLGYKPTMLKPSLLSSISELQKKYPSWKLNYISVPGHTPGSICIYTKEMKVAFTGDTVFKRGIGRYDFSYSNKSDLKRSLTQILALPKNTKLLPGHGEPTTVQAESDILSIYSL